MAVKISLAAQSGLYYVRNMLKSVIATPALIGSEKPNICYIPIEPETITQHGDAQVSENLLYYVEGNGKEIVNDNVAPGGWTWTISGYLAGFPGMDSINYFTPGVSMQKSWLRQVFKSGARVRFKDMENRMQENVVIQSLDITWQNDCANKQPVSLTLKQVNLMKPVEARVAFTTEGNIDDLGITMATEGGAKIAQLLTF